MRCNIRRIFTFAFAAFGATLVLLSLPRDNFGREWDEAPRSSESQLQSSGKRNAGLRAGRVGPQMAFQRQPNPPSLIHEDATRDPFDFPAHVNRVVLSKLHSFLSRRDLLAMAASECHENTTLAEYWMKTKQKSVPTRDSWERFYAQIGTCSVYNDDKTVDDLLTDLNRAKIKAVHIMDGGTQAKLVFTFDNDKQAVFKPMRFGRDYESDPNHFYFSDFERHNAEIATFHLDRVLGFRRAVPTVGRIVNMTSELYDKAEKKLKKTFFISPDFQQGPSLKRQPQTHVSYSAKNHCFVSRCDYYCDTTHAICGLPDLKEGSVQVFLPDEGVVPRRHNRSPYRRTYSKKNQVAEWQSDMNYCTDKVKVKRQYAHGRKLLDLVDLHILDYLIGTTF
ncbi:hypothetical protein Y032_0780g2299 [Ancylostoma ceylanicum]|uniref:FAM20 C-terminal domain-containing protein n=1 Tax=Ancylostoma ceylanicum TaxID=53326 RepID=A0A016WF19_9BILA|nr:hypothetical protein Y032_0780g2299 [Ancylostoma ceylanicum]